MICLIKTLHHEWNAQSNIVLEVKPTALDAILQLVVPFSSRWPSYYLRAAAIGHARQKNTIQLDLEVLIRDTESGRIELRSPNVSIAKNWDNVIYDTDVVTEQKNMVAFLLGRTEKLGWTILITRNSLTRRIPNITRVSLGPV